MFDNDLAFCEGRTQGVSKSLMFRAHDHVEVFPQLRRLPYATWWWILTTQNSALIEQFVDIFGTWNMHEYGISYIRESDVIIL